MQRRSDARNRAAGDSELGSPRPENFASDTEQSPNGEVPLIDNTVCSLRREPTPRAAEELTFLHANVRSCRHNIADLLRIIERSNFPTYVIFTETWLDKSFESITLP